MRYSKYLIKSIPFSFHVVNLGENGQITSTILDGLIGKLGERNQLTSASSYLHTMDLDLKTNIQSWSAWASEVGITNQKAKQFFQSVDNGSKSLDDLDDAIANANSFWTNLGMGALNAATNIGIMIAISLAAKAAFIIWDHFAHRIENIKKASEEAKDSIQELRNTFDDHKQLVSDVTDSYERLSKGVNQKTLENVSLSNDDYQEFLDINKRLGDAFPQLISTINENGDAVLTLGQNGRTASEDLKELLAQEQELQNYKIAENIDDYFAGVKIQIQETKAETADLQKQIEETNKVVEGFQNPDVSNIISFNGDIGNSGDLERLKIYQAAVDKFYKSLSAEKRVQYEDILSPAAIAPTYSGVDGTAFQFVLNAVTLTNDEKAELNKIIKEEANTVIYELNDAVGSAVANQKVDTNAADLAWKDFIPSLVSAMRSKSTFQDLDEASQDIAVQLVQGLQSDVAEQMGDDPFQYIYNEIIGPLTELDKNTDAHQKVVNAFNKLFNISDSDLSPDELKQQVDALIRQIAEILGKDPIELKVQLGFGNVDDLARNYTNSINATKTQYGDQSKNFDWGSWFKQSGIDTQEEIDNWNEIRAACLSAAEARKRYFKQNGKINNGGTLSEELDSISALSDGFESLEKIYASMQSKKPFDFSTLTNSKFLENFNIPELKDEYADFMTTIAKSPKDFNACKTSLDNLVTAFVYNSDAITNLNDDNAEAAKQYLELLGITNSEAVVADELARKHAEAALATRELTAATAEEGQELADSIIQLANESEATEEGRRAFMLYAAQKLASNLAINPNGDISALAAIVNSLGIATNAWVKYYQAKREMEVMAASGIQLDASGSSYKTFYKDKSGNVLTDSEAEAMKAAGKLVISTRVYEQAQKQRNDDLKTMGENFAQELEDKAKAMVSYSPTGSKSSGSGGSGSKGSSKDPTEFDWLERKLKLIDDQITKTKDNISELVGYKLQNAETDTAIDMMQSKIDVLQQMTDKYMESAKAVGLSADYIEKIQNGAIDIDKIGNETLAKNIKEYQSLYDKAKDCTDQIESTKKEIESLNRSKLDNIISQYQTMNDTISGIIDSQEKMIDLRSQSGDEVFADDYIDLAQQQLQLTRQNTDAYNALKSEMDKMDLKEGSDDWKKYNDQLLTYKNNMISAAKAVEDYKDSMTDLVYKTLDDYKNKMNSINSTISVMADLLGDNNLVDDTGELTDIGLAKVGLYAQQLANAKQEAAEYAEAMESLNEALDSGLITQDEYNDRMSDYRSSQESAVQATKEARDAILSLAKEGIQAEIDAKKKLTEETINALEAEKDLHDYTESINEKQKNITTLQKKIAALAGATSGAELAQRIQLQKDLADAQKDLYDTQYDHNLEQQKQKLNEEADAYEEAKNKEMDELENNLDTQEKYIQKYLNKVKANYNTVYDTITTYGNKYNLAATEDLTEPWESGSDAANTCADAIGDAIANINYEISSLDFTPLQELIDMLNSLGEYGLGDAGGSSQFEDISDKGTWHKGSGGRWWFGEDDDNYAQDGVYTINGKQYGFGKDGYMFKGWNNESGNWRYFDPDDGGAMAKSCWKQDDKGKWFYLDKSGAMVTDAAVKSKENDGYYYVDDDGKWDGETLTYAEVKERGLKIGYKKGTRSATPGLHPVDEEGRGSELIIAKNGTILNSPSGGEVVFTKEMTDKLFDFSKNPDMFVENLKKQSIPDIPMITNTVTQTVPVNINIAGNADMNTVNAIKEMLPKEMKKYATGKMWNDINTAGVRFRR